MGSKKHVRAPAVLSMVMESSAKEQSFADMIAQMWRVILQFFLFK